MFITMDGICKMFQVLIGAKSTKSPSLASQTYLLRWAARAGGKITSGVSRGHSVNFRIFFHSKIYIIQCYFTAKNK